jgi:phosphoribosylanthranilate isomerase
MVSTQLKICGITNLKDAIACADLGVDYLGFNFFPDSPRFITPERAYAIIKQVPSKTKSVGLLVRPKLSDVLDVIKQSGIEWVQIIEPQDFTDFLVIPVPVINVLRISEFGSDSYDLNGASLILLDTYTPNKFGGTGKMFDWSLIPQAIPKDKLVLAGGITPENIQDAIDQVNPAIIDVASGAEGEPGIKDIEKVKKMVEVVKGS